MFKVTTNIGDVMNRTATVIQSMQVDAVMRGLATTMLPVVKTRIHEDGKDASGNQIGTYSEGYMAVRTGVFKTNGNYKSGPRKGEKKDTGVFTKGKNKGSARPKYNRTGDTKVILSLTRQMENDFKVVQSTGGYGLGFTNELNFNKSQWCEKTYGKKIYALTDEEKALVEVTTNELVNEIIKGI